jgi:hypothetical protein
MVEPLPDVMERFLRLHTLRKSVWEIIRIIKGASVSTVSTGVRFHRGGYSNLYIPDIKLWEVFHTITFTEPSKTGRTVTTADLRNMAKDAICSGNYFDITPSDLANGTYKLPRIAHHSGAFDMDIIVKWLKNDIGMTPYMVHAHFRPFPRRSFDTIRGDDRQIFPQPSSSPARLCRLWTTASSSTFLTRANGPPIAVSGLASLRWALDGYRR